MRSIYDNPYKYACVCDVPIELAKIACLKHRHNIKEQRKHRAYCPCCKSKHLIFNMGSYEEGYGDFFECYECGETFDPSEIPNVEYFDYMGWADFDAVLYFSDTNNKEEGWLEACGATTHEEWLRFAKSMIVGKRY